MYHKWTEKSAIWHKMNINEVVIGGYHQKHLQNVSICQIVNILKFLLKCPAISIMLSTSSFTIVWICDKYESWPLIIALSYEYPCS